MSLKKNFKKIWIRLWGHWYRVYEDDIPVKELIIYHHQIYLKSLKNRKENL
jgi:hypothetical protein